MITENKNIRIAIEAAADLCVAERLSSGDWLYDDREDLKAAVLAIANDFESSTPTAASVASPLAQGPAFHTVFGYYEGRPIPIPAYSSKTEHGVNLLVMEAARKEGYEGYVADRLKGLGWFVGPVYATPQPAASVASGGEAAISDDEYCHFQYVEGSLAAIANRSEQVADGLEPMDTITKASRRAKEALRRLQLLAPTISRLNDAATAQPQPRTQAEPTKAHPTFDADDFDSDSLLWELIGDHQRAVTALDRVWAAKMLDKHIQNLMQKHADAALAAQPRTPAEPVTDEEIIQLAALHGLGESMNPIGLQTGSVFRTKDGYRTSELVEFADALLAAGRAAPPAEPLGAQAQEIISGVISNIGERLETITAQADVDYISGELDKLLPLTTATPAPSQQAAPTPATEGGAA